MKRKKLIAEEVHNKVYNYKTRYEQGFIESEIVELLKDYPDINMEKYNDAMMGNTCMMINNELVNYHCDVEKAILCGIENRDLHWYEWD